jgi:hypothetical protein
VELYYSFRFLCKEGAKGCDKDGNNASDWDHPKVTERLARLQIIYNAKLKEAEKDVSG